MLTGARGKVLAQNGIPLYFPAMGTRRQALAFQRAFLDRIGGGLQMAALFEPLPGVAFFAKDEASRFVRANGPLVRILGCRHEWEVLGRTDLDFRPPEMAAVYLEEDRRVMRSGHALAPHLQMVPEVGGAIRWQLVTKVPLRDRRGRVCGVAGAMYEPGCAWGLLPSFHRIEPALRHIHEHFAEPLTSHDLAALVHLSERQFVRRFREMLGVAPMRYVVRQRLHAACRDLVATDHPAGSIALDCGFYDQSAFTHAFRARFGLTPAAYRRRHLGHAGADTGAVSDGP
jgi:AraC-like DNA-binding protein